MSTEHLGVDVRLQTRKPGSAEANLGPGFQKTLQGPWWEGADDVQKGLVHQPLFQRPEKRPPGWLGYIGDEILSSYIGIVNDMIITNHCKDPYEPTSISWNVGVFFCVAHLSNEKTSMFTLKINGWNIIMEGLVQIIFPCKDL